jgi:hypothetical protein
MANIDTKNQIKATLDALGKLVLPPTNEVNTANEQTTKQQNQSNNNQSKQTVSKG